MLSDHAEFPRPGNFCTLILFHCIKVQIQDCIVCKKAVGFKFFVALFKGAHVIRIHLLLLETFYKEWKTISNIQLFSCNEMCTHSIGVGTFSIVMLILTSVVQCA